MADGELISTKQAAFEADVHGAQIFDAIRKGFLRVHRFSGRTLVTRESFNRYKRRLETKRALRVEERCTTLQAAVLSDEGSR